jgi:hypothetical protein
MKNYVGSGFKARNILEISLLILSQRPSLNTDHLAVNTTNDTWGRRGSKIVPKSETQSVARI